MTPLEPETPSKEEYYQLSREYNGYWLLSRKYRVLLWYWMKYKKITSFGWYDENAIIELLPINV